MGGVSGVNDIGKVIGVKLRDLLGSIGRVGRTCRIQEFE